MGIKNIVFDFGCVLVDLDKQRCAEAFNSIGAQAISTYVDECRQEDLFHDLETGHIDVDVFCNEVRRKSPACTASNEQICWAWNQLLTGIPAERVTKLHQLKHRYHLFLLSNTNPVHWLPCSEVLEGCFEKVFLSYEMHLVKPSQEIFERMLQEAGIKPEETLFIDDSKANCHAAESLGIRTLHVGHGDEWLNQLDELL